MRYRRKPLKNRLWYAKKKVLPAVKTFMRLLVIIILLAAAYLVLEVLYI